MAKRFRALLQIVAFVAISFLIQAAINAGFINPYYAHIMTIMTIFVVAAVSLNLINGICGQFSLGHAGFMAVGAYMSAILTKNPDFLLPAAIAGNPRFLIATLVGGIAAAFIGLLVGLPSLRLRGDYLAITTLGFGEIIRIIFLNWEFVGGASGYFGIPKYTTFNIGFLISVVTIIIIRNFINSSHGRACISIREDEIAAETMGVATTRYKVMAFVIAAFFAGVSGSMMAHLNRMVTPASFSFMLSIEILLMVVLGGLGSISGSIGSAIFLTYATEFLRRFRHFRIIIYSLMLILIMIFRPSGLLGTREISLDLIKKAIREFLKKIKNKGDRVSSAGTE